jgi:hypothetical protein
MKLLSETSAYGQKPERETLEEAYADLVSLITTTMSAARTQENPVFSVSVVEYVRGTKPPRLVERELYFAIADTDEKS